MTPGPVPIHPRVYRAMSKTVYHHRTPQFKAFLAETLLLLRKVMQTKNEIILITGSGTSAMEAAIANCVSPGDEVLNILGGKFAERWALITKAFGGVSVELPVEWGTSVDLDGLERVLDERPSIKYITMLHNETSTGVLHPAEDIGKIAKKHDKILIVDGITSVGGDYVYPDKWGFDLLVTGSQKCLGCPPGLSMVMVSDGAWEIMGKSTMPTFYVNLPAYRKRLAERRDLPYTPAVSLVYALHESLLMILEEGYENRVKRHRLMGEAMRAGFEAMGLELLADKRYYSNTLTAVKYPRGVDDRFRQVMREYGVLVAGGQSHLRGKIFRVAHMNLCGQREVLTALSVSELALKKLGYKVELGVGVKAAQKVFLKE